MGLIQSFLQWCNAGVKTLSDIVDEEGSFLSFPKFRKKYKIKTTFLRYFGLCNAIPKYWKEAFNYDLENESVTTGQSTQPLTFHFGLVSKHAHFISPKRSKSLHPNTKAKKPGF